MATCTNLILLTRNKLKFMFFQLPLKIEYCFDLILSRNLLDTVLKLTIFKNNKS